MSHNLGSELHLYNLTLQRASQITQAVHGSFSGTKQQLIAVARGKILELLKPDAATGRVTSLLSVEVFGVIRSLVSFRLTGGTQDYLAVGSDSGRITILEYDAEKNVFKRVHMETFGKSGCRRIVPGQYLAADPKGRAVMIGAIEKQKLVYILNRDAAARLTISSPLEAHKSQTITYFVEAVDVGFENPLFACLELDYEDVDDDASGQALEEAQQALVFYELDLGLNHVVRKESIAMESFCNRLIQVPGGSDGPGGVLACSDGALTWYNIGDCEPVTVKIPQRSDKLRDAKRTSIINCVATHKTKKLFFFLLQTDEGDMFKLTMAVEDGLVRGMIIKYFDTVPVASSMCLLKNGLLFVASEYGNHQLYQVSRLGDNEDEPAFFSGSEEEFLFRPRELLNLTHLDEVESLAPLLSSEVVQVSDDDSVQLLTLCGRGAQSHVKLLRHGLEISEIAVSELPGNPNAVWTVKTHVEDEYDAYIVVSFMDATIVLSIGETVEEVNDTGFLATTRTLSASMLGDDSLLQIYPNGVRHILSDKRVNEWKTPAKGEITHCAVNERQVAIALGGTELIYFELDLAGQLNEYSERVELQNDVTSMALGPVPEGSQRCRFLAIGMSDSTVRIISLDPAECLQPKAMQALPATAVSLCLVEGSGKADDVGMLTLFIGLENGVLIRTTVDGVTGEMSDTRTRYLGSRKAKLVPMPTAKGTGVMVLSTRPWLNYRYQGQPRLTPLSYETLESAHSLSSELCPDGIIAVSKNTMRVLTVKRLGATFHQTPVPTTFTPRKLSVNSASQLAIVIEGDHQALSETQKINKLAQVERAEDDMDLDEDDMQVDTDASKVDQERLSEKLFGEPKAGEGRWAGLVRILDMSEPELSSAFTFALEDDEFPLSVCHLKFSNAADEATYVVVGTVTGWKLKARSWTAASLLTFRMAGDDDRKTKLEFVHRTPVDALPCAVHPFKGRMLAGIGNRLRIYDLGKKKLLRKCETKHIPNTIIKIDSIGTRVFVGDQKESVFYVKYKPADNTLGIFADDANPRWTTTTLVLDFYTIAVADKFGNISVLRLPTDVSDEIEEDPTGTKAFWSRGFLNGSSNKVDVLANFHVGETVMGMHKAVLAPGGTESIVYTTMAGGVGVLMPFASRDDIEFFHTLELHLRQEHPPLLGRDHLAFRSSYFPVKSVVDGDLCEQFNALEQRKRKDIADELERSVDEVSKRLEDFRNRYAF